MRPSRSCRTRSWRRPAASAWSTWATPCPCWATPVSRQAPWLMEDGRCACWEGSVICVTPATCICDTPYPPLLAALSRPRQRRAPCSGSPTNRVPPMTILRIISETIGPSHGLRRLVLMHRALVVVCAHSCSGWIVSQRCSSHEPSVMFLMVLFAYNPAHCAWAAVWGVMNPGLVKMARAQLVVPGFGPCPATPLPCKLFKTCTHSVVCVRISSCP
mmetsp:Transcript_86203/g.224753  ORF Transcript_86203/g.224753 Transcript_86203/m.224753 type:complete len:216 (+) Transcript_86203:783-1430(+)